MRSLFTMDTKDYDPNGTRLVRPSVRGIIIKGDKVLLMHSLKYDYYKFPGGGIEPGECQVDTLCREVAEESGFAVVPESVKEYGLVHRITKGEESDIFDQMNYYYLCDISGAVGQMLDDYEAQERFTPEFVTPCHAIKTNRFHDHQGKWGIVQERDSRVLEMLMEEGYFQDETC